MVSTLKNEENLLRTNPPSILRTLVEWQIEVSVNLRYICKTDTMNEKYQEKTFNRIAR